MWHFSQSSPACAPERAKPVAAAWLQVTAVHEVGRWQFSQSSPSRVLKRSSCLRVQWQSAQRRGVPFVCPLTWQDAHGTRRCLPSSGHDVLWKARETVFHAPEGEWQLSQVAPSVPLCESLWHDAHEDLNPL